MGRGKVLIDSDKNKILALLEAGFTKVKIAKMYCVSPRTIDRVELEYKEMKELVDIKPIDDSMVSIEDGGLKGELVAKSQSIADIKEQLGFQTANLMNAFAKEMNSPDKIAKADLRSLAVAFGIVSDKHNIYRGINNVVEHDVKHSLVNTVRTQSQIDE